MSVELYRPPKPEENRKNSTEKTIPYPGFKPRTSGLAVGSLNHCTIGRIGFCNLPYKRSKRGLLGILNFFCMDDLSLPLIMVMQRNSTATPVMQLHLQFNEIHLQCKQACTVIQVCINPINFIKHLLNLLRCTW
jgi:hypothetical protein